MKTKIIYITKFILVFLPFIAIMLYSKYFALGFFDNETPYYIWNREFCKTSHAEYYRTLVIGDSMANVAFIPEVLSDSVLNLGLGGVTPVEAYYIMSDWIDHNKAPEDVFICFYDTNLEKSTTFWVRTMYSHRFTPFQNLEIINSAAKFGDTDIASPDRWFDYIAYELYLPSKYITSICNGRINQRLAKNREALELIDLHRGRYIIAPGTLPDIPPLEYSEFKVPELFDHYYRQLISLCLSNGCRVHLIKLPLPSDAIFTEEYINTVNEYYDTLKNDYPGIEFEWFVEDYGHDCFCDPMHFNTHGSLKFNAEVLKSRYSDIFDDGLTHRQKDAIIYNIINESSREDLIIWCKLCGLTITENDNGTHITITDPVSKATICEKDF